MVDGKCLMVYYGIHNLAEIFIDHQPFPINHNRSVKGGGIAYRY